MDKRGVVKVNMDDKNNVSYNIVKPVAWDYILLETEASDCFFGKPFGKVRISI